jgi:hypothetical protein
MQGVQPQPRPAANPLDEYRRHKAQRHSKHKNCSLQPPPDPLTTHEIAASSCTAHKERLQPAPDLSQRLQPAFRPLTKMVAREQRRPDTTASRDGGAAQWAHASPSIPSERASKRCRLEAASPPEFPDVLRWVGRRAPTPNGQSLSMASNSLPRARSHRCGVEKWLEAGHARDRPLERWRGTWAGRGLRAGSDSLGVPGGQTRNEQVQRRTPRRCSS